MLDDEPHSRRYVGCIRGRLERSRGAWSCCFADGAVEGNAAVMRAIAVEKGGTSSRLGVSDSSLCTGECVR